MKTSLISKYVLVVLLISFAINTKAQVLFETNFNSDEGWVAEGSASSTGTLLSRTITYNGKDFKIDFNQVAINPTDAATGNCSIGSANIQKNGQSTATKVSTSATNNGYILLPPFDDDIQISFARASSSSNDRQIVIETSLDNGVSWQVNADDAAPYLLSGCEVFTSPSKFAKGTRVRITNHSSKGGLKIYWLQVSVYKEDLIPPTLTNRYPGVDSTEISPSLRQISMTFNESVKAGGDGKIYVVGNTSGDMLELTSDALNYSGNTVTIPFSSTFFLNHNEVYTVLLEKGAIKDLSNNPNDEITWNFTTKVNVSSEKEILSVKIPKMVGSPVINSAAGTIDLKLAAGTDLANIQPANITFTISPFATIVNDYKDYSTGPQTYTVIAEDRTSKTWTITISLAQFKIATLPVVYKGTVDSTWQYIVADGWTNLIVNPDANTKMNTYSFYQASLSQTNQYLQNQYEGGANRVSFRARYGNNTSNYQVDLQESANGTDWTTVKSFAPSNLLYSTDVPPVLLQPTTAIPDPTPMLPTSSSTIGLRSYPIQPSSQYIRWYYTTRTNTSFYLDDVVIENAPTDNVAPTLLTNEPIISQNYSTNSKSQIIFKMSEAVKVSQDLINKTTGIHVISSTMDSVLYESKILTLRSGEVVLTDMPGLTDMTDYTVQIPNNALVDLSENPFAGTSFTFTYHASTALHQPLKDEIKIIQQNDILIATGAKSMEIYSTLGMLLKTSNNDKISVSELSRGIYIIRYKSTNGSLVATKILLNR